MTQEVSDIQAETQSNPVFETPAKDTVMTGDTKTGDAPASETFDKEYVQKLRDEAAKWRTQLRDVQTQLKDLQPLAEKAKADEEAQKSDLQKMADKLAKLEAQAQEATSKAEKLERVNKLMSLAAKANVPPELLDFLDVSKFDLEDEEKTLEALRRFGKVTVAASGGKASNPERTDGNSKPTEAELRYQHFGAGRSDRNLIFPVQSEAIGG